MKNIFIKNPSDRRPFYLTHGFRVNGTYIVYFNSCNNDVVCLTGMVAKGAKENVTSGLFLESYIYSHFQIRLYTS